MSRFPSRAEPARASRPVSYVDAKDLSYSVKHLPSPGRSYLELRLATAQIQGRRVVGLTSRDLAILRALDSYRYLDRHQIQGLFFDAPRSCQYRLKWLVDPALVHACPPSTRP